MPVAARSSDMPSGDRSIPSSRWLPRKRRAFNVDLCQAPVFIIATEAVNRRARNTDALCVKRAHGFDEFCGQPLRQCAGRALYPLSRLRKSISLGTKPSRMQPRGDRYLLKISTILSAYTQL